MLLFSLLGVLYTTLVLRSLPALGLGLGLDNSSWTPSTKIQSTNLTTDVQWDGYSLFVKGQRVFVWAGAVHPWRMAVPALWPDIFQRIKALGFNAIIMHTFWGLHNPSPGVLDFDGWKNLDPFFDAANEAGLWVIARPGPYIRAEAAAGGVPGWATTSNATSAAAVRSLYEPYWEAVGKLYERHQVTKGGPIIGVQVMSEDFLAYEGDVGMDHVTHLKDLMRSYGIVVPFTFNENPGDYFSYADDPAVDIYGIDSFPQSFDCTQPQVWNPVDTTLRAYWQNTSGIVGTPPYISEMQGGFYSGLGQQDLDQCLSLYGSDYEKVFFHNNIAQGVKMHDVYMIYGGTSFGHIAYPGATTSYDFWAAIEENRSLRDKYYELKSISHFVRHSRDLPKTHVAGSSDTFSNYTTAQPGVIRVDELRNPDTDAGFYVVRHENSSSLERTSFNVNTRDWQGEVALPIMLNGRDSRIMVTNYCWGASCISHSSAAVFSNSQSPELDTLVVYGTPDQPYQVAFPNPNATFEQQSGTSAHSIESSNGRAVLRFNITAGDHSVVTVKGGDRPVALHILDTAKVSFAWTVLLPGEGSLGNHYAVGSNETINVFGPYFVRSAKADGATLHLRGDLNQTTELLIGAPSRFTSFTWNDKPIVAVQGANLLWSSTLSGPISANGTITSPQITGWKWKDSLPEVQTAFDDSAWVTANLTSTSNPNKPYPGYNGKYVLYLPEYGFAVGSTVIRGHFVGTGNETGLNVSVSAGTGGAAAFWLNGQWVGSATVAATAGVEDLNTTISFPSGLILKNQENILTIVLDNASQDENNQGSGVSTNIQSPRGLRGYTLYGGDASGYEVVWKVQGNLGGFTDFPDKVRGIYNTGGLAGERLGWHLPGFDDADWQYANSSDLDNDVDVGVRFYRGDLEVDYPAGTDRHYSFLFPDNVGSYRAQLFVNGWQHGRRFGDYGPQTVFPVPPGILVQGHNTIALSVFTLNQSTPTIDGRDIQVRVDPVITTTTLDLQGLKVDSPDYNQVLG